MLVASCLMVESSWKEHMYSGAQYWYRRGVLDSYKSTSSERSRLLKLMKSFKFEWFCTLGVLKFKSSTWYVFRPGLNASLILYCLCESDIKSQTYWWRKLSIMIPPFMSFVLSSSFSDFQVNKDYNKLSIILYII